MTSILRSVEHVLVGNQWTRFSVMGSDLNVSAKGDDRVIFLMIPGNPGNEGYYAEFGRLVLENYMDPRALFYTVSHLNHVPLPSELRLANSPADHERFRLQDQVEHKLQFCRDLLPKSSKIVLLGHSIGSYMLLSILPSLLEDGFSILRAFALFPTVERMSDSPNGRSLRSVLSFLDRNDWLTSILGGCVEYLPNGIKTFLCRLHLGGSAPDCIVSSATELGFSTVIRNIIHMSNDELENVCAFDEKLIEGKTFVQFYYGKRDGWVPLDYAIDMKKRLGGSQVTIDEHECEHAFVIRDSQIVAEEVVKMLGAPQ